MSDKPLAISSERLAVSREPNPAVVAKIWNRVVEWAVESGRLDVSGERLAVSGEWEVIGDCPKCAPGSHCEIHLHPDGRKCGGTVCHHVFDYPSLEIFKTQYGEAG